MSDENTNILILLYLLKRKKQRNQKASKRFWVRKFYQERESKGAYRNLVIDLQLYDQQLFLPIYMIPAKFEQLLSMMDPYLVKESKFRQPTGAKERLCVTLKHLVSGDSHVSVGMSYRISPTTVGRVIKETCNVIWNVLKNEGFLDAPASETDWEKITCDFEKRWNFNNCVGAIDGKHVAGPSSLWLILF